MMSSTNRWGARRSRAERRETGDERLYQLVTQTCQHPPRSLERRQGLNQLIGAIAKSGKLWWENVPYYEDALQQTWLYLCRNLCEASTGGQYDATRSSVTTWLDRYLKNRLLDFRLEEQQHRQTRASVEPTTNPLDNLAAPPDIQPMLETIRHLVETDAEGELCQIHVKGRSDITCQTLLLRRLPPKTDWKTLAAEFNCSISTLANFYQRQCLPRLRKLGELQGYL